MSEKEIQAKVEEVLQETELFSVPVQIVAIANFYGFQVYEIPMDDNVSGMIVSDEKVRESFNTDKVIVVNANHSQTRRRFTVAHELGHYILQGKPTECYAHRDAGVYSPEEKDANSFASALLMPEKDIFNIVDLLKDHYGSINSSILILHIAERFNVSNSAAEVRLKKLNVI